MAHQSLLHQGAMKTNHRTDRSCSYVVALDESTAGGGDLRGLSEYLSQLGVIGCEVVVLDASSPAMFEEHARILRWVARHLAVSAPYDLVRTAASAASCDRIIIAGERVRYAPGDIVAMQALLDRHEVVEPQDYLAPLPWWGGIDAAAMLIHRGAESAADRPSTFAFRRGTMNVMRGFDATGAVDPVRRMAMFGAEVFAAPQLFVRCEPPPLRDWIRDRPRVAADDFERSLKTGLFFTIVPALLLVALFAGAGVASGALGALALGSVLLAVRGRIGAGVFFPLRACLYAPLWIVERSFAVYWALASILRQIEPANVPELERKRRERAASGE